MKKRLIIVIGVLIGAFSVFAQPNDSTAIPQEKALPADTIPPVEQPVVEQEAEDDSPRIIYYQSTEPDNRRRERRQDIKTLSGSMSHSGGFGALSFRSTKFRDESLVLAGLRGGWIINRTLGIGLEGHGIIPTAKFMDIDTVEVTALGGYGGMFLELIFFSNEVVHITFPVSGGAGWLGYDRVNEDRTTPFRPEEREVDGDVFWYVEPGAALEFNISRNFRLDFGVSKRFTQDLELQNTDPKAFDKLNYFVTLKIGGF